MVRKGLIIIISLVLMTACIMALGWVVAGNLRPQQSQPVQTSAVAAMASVPTTLPSETTEEPTQPLPDPPDMSGSTATHLFVYDVAGERLLFAQGDQTDSVAPASLTKLFTAYVALQYLEPGQMVTVGEEAGWIEEGSSVAAVSEGCRLSAGLILQGMLMQSGNDAAYAIAVAAGREIERDITLAAKPACAAFVNEMNRQLEDLGFTDTHFTNPDGIDDEGHYTTPAELLQIALLALDEPLIREYCSLDTALVTFDSGEEYTWKNTNFLLSEEMEEFYCPEATGLKTGSTSHAGKSLIATFKTETTTLIVGVLGCEKTEQRFEDALTLFNHYR